MNKEVKKKALLSVGALILVAILAFGIWFFFFKGSKEEPDDGIFYYPANYEEDIFQNAAYMNFRRDLMYSYIGVEQLFVYSEDYSSATVECKFFMDYFQTLMNGDFEKILDFYVEGYFPEKPQFTMQMIYEPYVLYHSKTSEVINGEDTELYNFHVRYAIFKNNGTFRKGVSSGESVPQIYQLIKNDDGSYRIYRILEVEFENEA